MFNSHFTPPRVVIKIYNQINHRGIFSSHAQWEEVAQKSCGLSVFSIFINSSLSVQVILLGQRTPQMPSGCLTFWVFLGDFVIGTRKATTTTTMRYIYEVIVRYLCIGSDAAPFRRTVGLPGYPNCTPFAL